jgi:hypothetical protein
MQLLYYLPDLNVRLNQRNLTAYTDQTRNIWIDYFGENHAKKVYGKKLHLGQRPIEKREPSI